MVKIMKILILQPPTEGLGTVIKQAKELMQKKASEVIVEVRDSSKAMTCEDVRKSEADLFVNFDLAGFGQSTLTDGIAYNLLDCKQIHILLGQNLPNEKYLAKQLSISMFFYCEGPDYYQTLLSRYPDIPWLKEFPDLNAEALCGMIQEIARICRL